MQLFITVVETAPKWQEFLLRNMPMAVSKGEHALKQLSAPDLQHRAMMD
jgi:hypothetical protein